jgi:hypothetical protein
VISTECLELLFFEYSTPQKPLIPMQCEFLDARCVKAGHWWIVIRESEIHSLLEGLHVFPECGMNVGLRWQEKRRQIEAALRALFKGSENTFNNAEKILHVHRCRQATYPTPVLTTLATVHNQKQLEVCWVWKN